MRILYGLFLFVYFQLGYLWAMQGASIHAVQASYWIDHAIPLVPFFIIFYMAGYFFAFVYAFKEKSESRFQLAMSFYFLLLTCSFLIFKFFPVEMQKTYAAGEDLFSYLTYSQQRLDTSYNNFPSLHVSINLFTFLLLKNLLTQKLKFVAGIFTFCIVISTLLVKQHLFIDVVGGLMMGGLTYLAHTHCDKKYQKYAKPVTKITIGIVALLCASQYQFIGIMLRSFQNYFSILIN